MSWDDVDDEWTERIDASHPVTSGKTEAHNAYAKAMKMVGNRHSKQALVELVCWLLQEAKPVE